MPRAVIFANGKLPDLKAAGALLKPDDVIVCADGGLRHVRQLGLRPHTVIGDMDSLTKTELSELTGSGVQINLHPVGKNATDLDLAVKFVDESNFSPIIVVGGLGGRLDHTLANIGLLANPAYTSRDLRLDDGVEEVFFCRDKAEVRGRAGDEVSLIPWGGVAGGVRTRNLKYPLNADYLVPEETLGISNVMLGVTAAVSISFGLLLIVHRRLDSGASGGNKKVKVL